MTKPEHIVRALLESTEEEDPKEYVTRNHDAIDRQTNWHQIDGDFGDAWAYGGSWQDSFSTDILHIDGLEGEGLKDVEAWDIELTDEDMAPILAQFPMDQDDPNTINDNERDRDEAIDSLKQQKADADNEAQEVTVYHFLDEPIDNDDWPDLVAVREMMDMSEEDFDSLSTASKWLMVGQHYGFHELDHQPDKTTKAQLSKRIGIPL